MNCNIYNKEPVHLTQKIIIFDSPDGTGKTNMATALSKDLGVPYFRMDSQHDNWRKGRFKDALEFDQTYLSSFLRQTKTNVIIDRAYPSEWVYSRVYGRETNDEVLTKIDTEFARMGAYIVVPLRRDYSKSRPDEVVTPEKLQPLHDMYIKFCEWTRCSTIKIYVDDFGDDIEKELPLLKGEFDFDRKVFNNGLAFTTDVTLARPFHEKDVSDLFKVRQDPIAGKTVGFKGTQK